MLTCLLPVMIMLHHLGTDCLETCISSNHCSRIELYFFQYCWTAGLSVIVIPSIVGTAMSPGGESLGLSIIVFPSVFGTAVSLGGEGLGLSIIIIPSTVWTTVSLGGESLSGDWIVER